MGSRSARRARAGPAWLAAVLAGATVVALYVWDDVLFAAPVVAVTLWLGPIVALVGFSLLYGGGSFVLALLAVRAYDAWSGGEPSRLQAWLARQEGARRGAWGRRLLASGRVVGFVVSSFLLGGILTTWMVRYGGRREGIVRVAAASSAIFGVTFSGMYVLVALGVLHL